MERWICPHCNFAQIINDESKQTNFISIDLVNTLPSQSSYRTIAYGRTNPKCRQISLYFHLYGFVQRGSVGKQRNYMTRQLLPKSSGKSQPDCIPYALREDYHEACAIRELSPKAAATLVRRCLQGMIRDFCGIKDKRTLFDEIKALEALVNSGNAPSGVTQESVQAIDKVRSIGNIGAHMEKDIDLIIDVDTNEAKILIELVEMLFEEWYVSREQRQERLARISAIADDKEDAKKGRSRAEVEIDAGGFIGEAGS